MLPRFLESCVRDEDAEAALASLKAQFVGQGVGPGEIRGMLMDEIDELAGSEETASAHPPGKQFDMPNTQKRWRHAASDGTALLNHEVGPSRLTY